MPSDVVESLTTGCELWVREAPPFDLTANGTLSPFSSLFRMGTPYRIPANLVAARGPASCGSRPRTRRMKGGVGACVPPFPQDFSVVFHGACDRIRAFAGNPSLRYHGFDSLDRIRKSGLESAVTGSAPPPEFSLARVWKSEYIGTLPVPALGDPRSLLGG